MNHNSLCLTNAFIGLTTSWVICGSVTLAAPQAPTAAAPTGSAEHAQAAAPAQAESSHSEAAAAPRAAEAAQPAVRSPAMAARPAEPSRAVTPAAPTAGINPAERDRSSVINGFANTLDHRRPGPGRPPNWGSGSTSFPVYPLWPGYGYVGPTWTGFYNSDNNNQDAGSNQTYQPDAAVAQPSEPAADQTSQTPTAAPPQAAVADVSPTVLNSAPNSAVLASPQWRDADAQVRIAQAVYDSAAARVLTHLHAQPAYQEALARKDQDASQLAAIKSKDPNAPIAHAEPAATAKLDDAKSVTDMENGALLADPQAASAKIALDAALARRNEAVQAVAASAPHPVPSAAR